jgi:hypothetical protein
MVREAKQDNELVMVLYKMKHQALSNIMQPNGCFTIRRKKIHLPKPPWYMHNNV